MGRNHTLFPVIPRYGRAIIGLPPNGRCFVFTNSERGDLACDRKWLHRHGERLSTRKKARPLSYGDGWHKAVGEVWRWWRDKDATFPTAQVMGERPPEFLCPPERKHLALPGRGTCPWCDGFGYHPDDLPELKYPGSPGRPCPECDGSGMSALHRVAMTWIDQGWDEEADPEEVDREILTLFRAVKGYLKTWGADPPEGYRVVGVELEVAAQVVHPLTGKPYTPRIPLVEEEGMFRLPHPGEWSAWNGKGRPPGGIIVSWPWYQVGTLDVVLQSREDPGALWVHEMKSSRDTLGYLEGIVVDPQVQGYTWILQENIKAGRLPFTGPVAGVFFDVASSSLQHTPHLLKEKSLSKKEKELQGKEWAPPAFSQARNITTPSWLYQEALEMCLPNPDGDRPDPDDYQDHLQFLRESVDPKLYRREPLTVNPEDIARYRAELYGVATRIASHWRTLSTLSSPAEMEIAFPRTPICRLPGGSCPYRGPCLNEGAPENEFETGEGLIWSKTAPMDETTNTDNNGGDQPYPPEEGF